VTEAGAQTVPAAARLHWPTVFETQAVELLRRARWDIGLLALIMLQYHIGAWALYQGSIAGMPLFVHGGLGFPGLILFGLLAAFWGLRVWHDLPPDGRDYFMAQPVSQAIHTVIRVTAGAAILLAITAATWIIGALIAELIQPGTGYFAMQRPLGTDGGWIVTLIGMLNLYLYATCLALLLEKPEYWLLFWIPIGLFVLWALPLLVGWRGLAEFFRTIIVALLSGTGVGVAFDDPIRAFGGSYSHSIVLVWLMIWSGAVWTIARARLRS
jgi:hypothetical protein